MRSDHETLLNSIYDIHVEHKFWGFPVVLTEYFKDTRNKISRRMDRMDAEKRNMKRRVK